MELKALQDKDIQLVGNWISKPHVFKWLCPGGAGTPLPVPIAGGKTDRLKLCLHFSDQIRTFVSEYSNCFMFKKDRV